MVKATIFFSDRSFLELHEGSLITPIVLDSTSDFDFASMSSPTSLQFHPTDGLIPDIMGALCLCDFFYIDGNHSTVYSKNSIVKIQAE